MIEINDNASMVNHKMSGRASILFFYAKWQEESLTKDLMELLTALCTKFPTITFLKIDAENLLQISEQFRISVVPSFVALHNQIIVGKVEGAHPSDLSKLVKQLAALDSQAVPMNSISASQEEFPVPLNTTLRKLISTGLFNSLIETVTVLSILAGDDVNFCAIAFIVSEAAFSEPCCAIVFIN